MNKSYKDLPSFPYIQKIADELWKGAEYGNASVMVGAGFSRNAKKISDMKSQFPLWSDLANKMFDELYGSINLNIDDLNKLRFKKTNGLEVLKLASEYEALHKISGLNKFIKANIPDSNFTPSELHNKLLNLPWADIFTTNYDTLLERTLINVISKNYEIIYNIKDIPFKQRPRIVKLHGSLPSYYPFIITEEDYRRYPHYFAPFVNLVQQSMLENVFCLIGFSASDPNFLAWKGWVRDNLGENAPNIYMIGLFDLTKSEEEYFSKSMIRIIDLSILFPKNVNDRYYNALLWFLNVLETLKPKTIINWPEI